MGLMAGEMGKSMFPNRNYYLPLQECVYARSANVGEKGRCGNIFRLSGNREKRPFQHDPKRQLIGDDEHGCGIDNGVFN